MKVVESSAEHTQTHIFINVLKTYLMSPKEHLLTTNHFLNSMGNRNLNQPYALFKCCLLGDNFPVPII